MDQLPPLGRAIFEVIPGTYSLYGDLLRANTTAIHSTHRETFSYGPHDRNQLDLYTPSPSAPVRKPRRRSSVLERVGDLISPSRKGRPILVFVYGGGFVQGSKVVDAVPGDVLYKNVGYFFADKLGYDTVVMDYRLLGHGAKFPNGGEDVDGAIKWAEEHFGGDGVEREMFIMGNSAGAVHVCTWLFGEQFHEHRLSLVAGESGVRLAGTILLGGSMHFGDVAKTRPENVKAYFGESIEEKAPIALMKKEREREVGSHRWPPLLVLVSEFDPEEMIVKPNEDFVAEWTKLGGADLDYRTLKGHNHISPPLGLGTGVEKEEEWGFEVGKWMEEKR